MQTVWFKNKGGGGAWAPRAPLLDPPLLKEAPIDKKKKSVTDCNYLFLLKLISLIVFESSFCCL